MKKFAAVFLTLLIGVIVVNAQSAVFNRVDSLDKRPLVIINGKTVDPLSFLALDKQDFQDLKIYTSEEAMKKFGNSHGRFGAIEVTLVKNAKIFTWPELVKHFYFIASKIPVKGKLQFIDFDELEFNDQRSFIASASTVISMGIDLWDYHTGKPRVFVRVKHNININQTTYGPYDKEIDAIILRFDRESMRRDDIEGSKTVIRG